MGIQFQPSEIAKGAVVLAVAQILSAMQTTPPSPLSGHPRGSPRLSGGRNPRLPLPDTCR